MNFIDTKSKKKPFIPRHGKLTATELNENNLRKIINREVVGDSYPFDSGKPNQVDYYIKDLIENFKRSNLMKIVSVNFGNGCGYASYVDVFLTKKDGSTITKDKKYTTTIGITLYICRLAPVAVLGLSENSAHDRGGGHTVLNYTSLGKIPNENWNPIINEINLRLNNFGYIVLRKREVQNLIDFDVDIRTIYTSKNEYRIFDALFYFED